MARRYRLQAEAMKERTDAYAATPVGKPTKAGRVSYATKRDAAAKFLAEIEKRPRIYSPQIAAAICERIAGGETMVGLARDPNMPTFPTMHAWGQTNAEFASRLARARLIQSHALAEVAVQLADDASNDIIVQPNGMFTPNNAAVQRSRLQVDQRRWLAGKLNPAAYADKQIHTGPDGLGPVEVQVRADYERLTTDELDQLRDLLERAAGVQIEGRVEPEEPAAEEPSAK